nr:CNT_HP1_G0057650.mRNA.1.CDS.1 [Saccharomyces cerevisiae]
MWLPSKIKKIMNYDYGELLKASFCKNTFEVLVFKLDMVGIILSSAGFTLLMLGLGIWWEQLPMEFGYHGLLLPWAAILLLLFVLTTFIFCHYWGFTMTTSGSNRY